MEMTDKQPTQEQIRKLWEWVGWEFSKDGKYWRVNSQASGWGTLATLPQLDLNFLFKFVVPRFFEVFGEFATWKLLSNWVIEVATNYDAAKGNEAVILRKTIWEVIHGS